LKSITALFLLNPGYTEAYVELGSCKHKLKRYDEAIENYAFAIQQNPNASAPYQGMGASKIELGKYDEAINYLDKAISLNAINGDYFFN